MNKAEFLQILKKELKNVTATEKQDIINDYTEHFDMSIEKGKSEEEIAIGLGDPRKIAKELEAIDALNDVKKNVNLNNIVKLLFSLSSLGLFNIIFLFPYLFILNTLIFIAFIAIALLFGGMFEFCVGFMNIFIPNFIFEAEPIPSIFSAIVVMAIGFVMGFVNIILIKYFYKFTIYYLKMNLKIIREERE